MNTNIHTKDDIFTWLYTYTEFEQICMEYYRKNGMLIPPFIRDNQVKKMSESILDTMRPVNTAQIHLKNPDHEKPTSMKRLYSEDNFINKEDAFSILKHPRYDNGTIHSHTFFEFVYVFHGTCHHTIFSEDNRELLLHTNDVMLIAPQTYHKIIVDDDSIVLNLLVRFDWMSRHVIPCLPQGHSFSMELSKMIIERNTDSAIIFRLPNLSMIREALFDMILEYCTRTEYKNELLNLHFCKLLIYMIIYGETEAIHPGYHSSISQLVPAITAYVNENFASINCQDIAEHFHFSVSYLNSTFQKTMNLTLNQYLINTKLGKACEYLSTTRLPISEISSLVGYADAPSFNRVFRQNKGISPSQYRKENTQ